MTTVTIAIPLPLCPNVLSKNGRGHWSARYRAMRDQREWAGCALLEIAGRAEWPWPAAVMDVAWRYYAGRPPDDDNVWARVAGVRDACQARGLVRNDHDIRTGRVTFSRVAAADTLVVVTLRRDDGEERG
jgi:hypothetical protein